MSRFRIQFLPTICDHLSIKKTYICFLIDFEYLMAWSKKLSYWKYHRSRKNTIECTLLKNLCFDSEHGSWGTYLKIDILSYFIILFFNANSIPMKNYFKKWWRKIKQRVLYENLTNRILFRDISKKRDLMVNHFWFVYIFFSFGRVHNSTDIQSGFKSWRPTFASLHGILSHIGCLNSRIWLPGVAHISFQNLKLYIRVDRSLSKILFVENHSRRSAR